MSDKTAAEILAEQKKANAAFLAESEESIRAVSSTLTSTVKAAFNDLANLGTGALAKFKEINSEIINNKDIFDKFSKSYITFRELTKTKDVFSGLNNSTATFGMVKDQIESMGTEWKHLTDIMGKIPGASAGGAMLTNIKDNAGFGQKAEAQMISMLSAGGNLNKMFDAQGKLTVDLAASTAKYVNSMGAVGQANGMTLATTLKYADELHRVPGIMDETINMGTELGGNMSALSATMKVMSGSGQNIDQVMKAMNTAYANLGNPMGAVVDKGQKGLTLFATMSTLSKDLNMQFGETAGFLGKVAEQFKFVGNNTEAAARVMVKFMDALRNTGLTSSASTDIIQGMIKSVGELTIGTKAFVSARQGGPGGFQGAMQMEKMNREGKSDEVMMMVLNTMKQQFGGRIVTSDEATQNQDNAAQFVKQREMMKSGIFGNMVGTGPGADEKATKLLDALASGDMGKAAKVGQTALQTVGMQGNNLQKESNTILNKIALSTERSAAAAQLTALVDLKKFLGSGNTTIKNMMEKDMRSGASTSGDKKTRNIENTTAEQGEEKILNMIQSSYKDLLESIDNGSDGAKKMVSEGLNRLEESSVAVKKVHAAMALKVENKRKEDETPKLPEPPPKIPAAEQRKALTEGVDPGARQAATQASTRSNATAQTKIDNNVNVTVHLSAADELKKWVDAKAVPTKGSGGTIVQNLNSRRNEPGNRSDPGY